MAEERRVRVAQLLRNPEYRLNNRFDENNLFIHLLDVREQGLQLLAEITEQHFQSGLVFHQRLQTQYKVLE